MRQATHRSLTAFCALACVAGAVAGAAVQGPQGMHLSSAVLDGDGAAAQIVDVGVVSVAGAGSMRIVVGDWNLGAHSRVILRSLLDGHTQRLNADTMPAWSAGSAYFNGDSVEVFLEVAPGDRGVYVVISDALVEWPGEPVGHGPERTICGSADNRVASSNPRVGRFPGGDPSGCQGGGGCTAWIFSNGAMLTAGHCGPGDGAVVQFNVPLSDSDGTLNHPGPEDQYVVDGSTVVNANSGNMNDWSIFQVHPNSETGLLPVIAQGAFFRGSIDDVDPATTSIRITGFGFDDDPPGSCNWTETHKAQQTHAGSYEGYVDNGLTERFHRYRADTRGANSGSPIIVNGTFLTLGIHTNGGCNGDNPETGSNRGPSFRNVALFVAVQGFLGPNARYADANHPATVEEGTLFRPFATLPAAFDDVPNNGTVFLVRGSYTAANGNAINYGGKSVTLRAPSGPVVIGN